MNDEEVNNIFARLEIQAIREERMGDAYECLPAEARSVLKKCIALLHRVWGESAPERTDVRLFRQGVGVERGESPVSFALLACEAAYASPQGFLAALMPAVLAGVEHILPCFLWPAPLERAGARGADASGTDSLPSAALLAALELAGVERAFFSGEEALLQAMNDLHEAAGAGGSGRLVLLGSTPFAESLGARALQLGLPCFGLMARPLYFSERSGEMAESVFCPTGESGGLHPGVSSASKLYLDAAHEDVWIWPDLGPEWFSARRIRVFRC